MVNNEVSFMKKQNSDDLPSSQSFPFFMIHCTHVWDMLHDFCIYERYDLTQSLEQLIPCFVAGLFICTYVPMTLSQKLHLLLSLCCMSKHVVMLSNSIYELLIGYIRKVAQVREGITAN